MADADIVAGRTERTLSILADLRTPDVIYAHICNGGSLIDLCETWDVRYCDVARWIDSDPGRKKLYEDALMARNRWTDEMVLGEARLLARFDLRKLYDKNGRLKNIADLDAETARAVQGIDTDELFEGTGKEREQVGETKKVKLWDKLKAMEMIMKHRGLVVDRHQVQQVVSLEDIISGSWNAPLPGEKPAAPPAVEEIKPVAVSVEPASDLPPAPAAATGTLILPGQETK